MAQPEGRVAGDAACAVQELCHPVGRHGNLSSGPPARSDGVRRFDYFL
jgi:hypothetical protein